MFFWSFYLIVDAAIDTSFGVAVADHSAAFFMIIITFVFGWCLCSLSFYHCWLISNHLTTNEHIKESGVAERRGLCFNLRQLYCTDVPPPNIDLHGPPTHLGDSMESLDMMETGRHYDRNIRQI